ncbi:uncharacterized protein DFL_008315 [Arthrobotrys flagrans]|uniref:Uncharacterized protein n=1 Tax=Arthrobotrys flagrans TaxID=97331 RepID=A0A436ZNE5_ARTFL|nr:hypothetical protein DFL_008315 [Arthrobotrys flagrans]
MKFFTLTGLCAIILPFATVSAGVITPPWPSQSKELWMGTYKYENDQFSGQVWTKQMNCGNVAQPLIQVFWARGEEWQETPFEPKRSWFDSQGNVWYNFAGPAPGATQFYLKLTCLDRVIYDPGNFVNYQIQRN